MSNALSGSTEEIAQQKLGKTNRKLREEARQLFKEIAEAKAEGSSKPTGADGTPTSVRLKDKELRHLKECVEKSPYDNISEYIRHVGLGWDRNGSIIARTGIVLKWVQEHMGENIGQKEWEELYIMLDEVYEHDSEQGPDEESITELLEIMASQLLAAKRRMVTEEVDTLMSMAKEKASRGQAGAVT